MIVIFERVNLPCPLNKSAGQRSATGSDLENDIRIGRIKSRNDPFDNEVVDQKILPKGPFCEGCSAAIVLHRNSAGWSGIFR
jgi:hypothetical protein